MEDTEDDLIIKCFTQSPNVLLYGLPQLPIQDKWALLALMGLCWDRSQTGKCLEELEGPYKLSLREISHITGVDYTVLRSKQGKNPREGVLDRLERFGYVDVREGRPVDEYTEILGREQTYLYIRLRRIWEENMLFAEEWRVPSNRLTDPDFVIFTVDQANSAVGNTNNGVGNNNSSVDQANHTVDAVSTNYVLRQRNTKKTMKDSEQTSASNDAAYTRLHEELIKKLLRYMKKYGSMTCHGLEKFLHRYIETSGSEVLSLSKYKNAVVWDGVSDEYCEVFKKLQNSGKVQLCFGDISLYEKVRKPKLPVATEMKNHREPQWHPMFFKCSE